MLRSRGIRFVLTEPDQYIYNPSFHFKTVFMAAQVQRGGVLCDVVTAATAPTRLPTRRRSPRSIAVLSLSLWIFGVIIAELSRPDVLPSVPAWPRGPRILRRVPAEYDGDAPR